MQPTVSRITYAGSDFSAQFMGAEHSILDSLRLDGERHIADEREGQGTFHQRLHGGTVAGWPGPKAR